MTLTIGQTIEELHVALREYIEATYHISNEGLIHQRRQLLNGTGVIHQRPYLESTPRYQVGESFRDLGLPTSCLDLFEGLARTQGSHKPVLHDPPWEHQSIALSSSLNDGKSLLVTTGTGSGKTECFLLPILGKLAREASTAKDRFGTQNAVRAMVLYPMNALVNDQLGRLRLLFADPRVVDQFMSWSGRSARFARYTSRTLYPGVRTKDKDQKKLSVINHFYIDYLNRSTSSNSLEQAQAADLVNILKEKGKWPAKDDLEAWYGRPRQHWLNAQDEFQRCITLPRDAELFTRHEVQVAPPDILVTNYSMLEYMLMRPLERPIFDQTAAWLRDNPNENFLLVVDEAHLYRGAAGAEVALLIRRLRSRLGIPPERLQVICTSASFDDPNYGIEFAAQLTGKQVEDFAPPIRGNLDKKRESAGSSADAQLLAEIDIREFYDAETNSQRQAVIQAFLSALKISDRGTLESTVYHALCDYGPLGLLINHTMEAALPIDELGSLLFPDDVEKLVADRAVSALVALGSFARRVPEEPGLLPCRVHSFYRGLAGLWACMDPNCSSLAEDMRGGPTGKLYSQPRDECACGARVLELFTCRHCGTAYARAYTDNLENPSHLWSEPGGAFRTLNGMLTELHQLDMLIEGEPVAGEGELHSYDFLIGQLNPTVDSSHTRTVFLPKNRDLPADDTGQSPGAEPGQYCPCAVCSQKHDRVGRSSVQDHQTKGDQPFQALVTKQIDVQAPSPKKSTSFAPLRGRKVLAFSDSRQTAARLAPNLQKYSMQDVMRPLLLRGYRHLQQSDEISSLLNLEDAYFAVLLAAAEMSIRLRPPLRGNELFSEAAEVRSAVCNDNILSNGNLLVLKRRIDQSNPPVSIQHAIKTCITDRYYGVESLGLASIVENPDRTSQLENLPAISGLADTQNQKLALARLWLRTWALQQGYFLRSMPPDWQGTEVQPHSGSFSLMDRFMDSSASKRLFKREWLPQLLRIFGNPFANNKHLLRGAELTLEMGGEWAYCTTCRTTQRPFPNRNRCINCQQPTVGNIDPDRHEVFSTRKRFYRNSTTKALRDGNPPMALIAAEHTAQLNSSQSADVFSKAEEHELLFQDVDLGPDEVGRDRAAIDILSCTTTMEVGIDIGALSGVALRNMPPARANYQQRAGRAGRRGTSIATVTAFGSADSHDEHYFSQPHEMIRGKVDDPRLTINNESIAKRHVLAYLLQRYHQDRIQDNSSVNQRQLFEVLGTVIGFLNTNSVLNLSDFVDWLQTNESELLRDLESWLPHDVFSADWFENLAPDIESTLSGALGVNTDEQEALPSDTGLEVAAEVGEEQPPIPPDDTNLLDRLLYKGVLPRYAFPTDVATFHVFKHDTNAYRPEFLYSPSQSLAVALTQYAPGKEVWIDNKLWHSGAIYSTVNQDRYDAWQKKRLYFECQVCHYSVIEFYENGHRGEVRDCDACGAQAQFGPARPWLRPPGFAHRVNEEEGTTPDDQPARSYATRAKLMAPTPPFDNNWDEVNKHIRTYSLRDHLLVTNRGPREEGYNYCTKCGLIDPSALPHSTVLGEHRKPFPTNRDHNCPGDRVSTGIVLGTEFPSDILLMSLHVNDPVRLRPGDLATNIALRTLSEALSTAGCRMLGLEALEIQAEYRPAVTEEGQLGYASEIFLYDTLPGGAGFAQRVGELGDKVMYEALALLEGCPDRCDRSCYRCLRSYKNKFEHDLLDRHLGASLLRYLLDDKVPTLDSERIERATERLESDLQRQTQNALQIERNVGLSAPGLPDISAPILIKYKNRQFVVGVHNPLTPEVYSDPNLNDWADFGANCPIIPADELVVRRNLPSATKSVLKYIGV